MISLSYLLKNVCGFTTQTLIINNITKKICRGNCIVRFREHCKQIFMIWIGRYVNTPSFSSHSLTVVGNVERFHSKPSMEM